MWGLFVLILATALSAAVIRTMLHLAPHVGLIDHPGEHKQHDHSTPYVGGFGVLAALLLVAGLLLWMLPALVLSTPVCRRVHLGESCGAEIVRNVVCLALLAVCIVFSVSATFNPFIYFRF